VRRDFIPTVQHKVAMSALPISALRGNGAGVTAAAREFLRTLDLAQFAVSNASRFANRLENATRSLQGVLPRDSASWGVARKALNLFLRDALYNVYLRDRFKLRRAEACLEIPLDGVVAVALRTRTFEVLPAWRGVKYLTPSSSCLYQDAAMREAQQLNIPRVHLDIYLWTQRD
jgi:hypothetical protein